jgi:hypothetical protein
MAITFIFAVYDPRLDWESWIEGFYAAQGRNANPAFSRVANARPLLLQGLHQCGTIVGFLLHERPFECPLTMGELRY